jgi:hypothetical protein
MRTATRRLAVITSIVVFTSACGGGGGVSAEDFVDDLEDICRDLERDLDRLDEPDSYESLADLARDARDLIEDALDEMADLEVPEDLQRDMDDFLELVEENSDIIRDLGRAAADQDDATIADLNDRLATVREDRNEVAEDLGADRCISEDDEDPEPTTDSTAPAATTTTPAPTTPPTTAAPVTAPPISQVPITPPTTASVDPAGIGTIDIATAFAPPAGFVLQDAGEEALSTIKDALAITPSLAGNVRSVGATLIVDETDTVAAVMFLTFWTSDISGTPVQQAFEDELTNTAESFTYELTPDGLEHVLYTDPDGTVGLAATSNDVSLWLIVQPGQAEFAQLLVDDFLEANAG